MRVVYYFLDSKTEGNSFYRIEFIDKAYLKQMEKNLVRNKNSRKQRKEVSLKEIYPMWINSRENWRNYQNVILLNNRITDNIR